MLAGDASTAIVVDAVEKAALSDGALVLQNRIHLESLEEMAACGYALAPADEEGLWAARQIGEGQLRIGSKPGAPGCRIRFEGAHAAVAYEALLRRLLARGFAFPGGQRKPAEPLFVLDTLIQSEGVIGIVSMFRINDRDTTTFAMTLFPS